MDAARGCAAGSTLWACATPARRRGGPDVVVPRAARQAGPPRARPSPTRSPASSSTLFGSECTHADTLSPLAAHRTKRPWQGAVEPPQLASLPAYDPKCYLCPGNERAGGALTAKYDGTFVFENDFAALLPDEIAPPPPAHDDPAVASLFRTENARGKCYVICFAPRHDLTIAEMGVDDVVRVVETWCVLLPPSRARILSPTSSADSLPRTRSQDQAVQGRLARQPVDQVHPDVRPRSPPRHGTAEASLALARGTPLEVASACRPER